MGPKDYRCPFCSKRSKKRQHMQNHIRTHTGELPFECEMCGKKFNQESNCYSHMRNCNFRKFTAE